MSGANDQELEAFLETLTVAGLKTFARRAVAENKVLKGKYDKKLDDLSQRIEYLLNQKNLLDQKERLLDQMSHPRAH